MLLYQGLLKETERRKAELSGLMETSAGLQALVQGSEAELEDKIFSLNESWGQVRTLTEDWLSAVLVGATVSCSRDSPMDRFLRALSFRRTGIMLLKCGICFLPCVCRVTRTK